MHLLVGWLLRQLVRPQQQQQQQQQQRSSSTVNPPSKCRDYAGGHSRVTGFGGGAVGVAGVLAVVWVVRGSASVWLAWGVLGLG
jgi:hypothetical protein